MGESVESRKSILTYVDSMMIVDKNMNVIYTNRFNSRYNSGLLENEYINYINKRYFEVYPDLDPKESTMAEALKYGHVIIREGQTFNDMLGRVYTTNNITYPIIKFGEIIGALELSQDITSLGDLENPARPEPKSKTGEILLQNPEQHETTFEDIITINQEMLENIRKARIFALEDKPTLIYGETGTGKEMFVEAMVHSNSNRNKKYIAQNCAAIPENLFESILFGSVKGAFTGAENKIGLFELADKGVLFLDELNSMPLHLQAKLLRVLQNGKVRPVGSATEKNVDVKVIVALNQNPLKLIKESLLREDLFYRLSSNTIYLTPIRDRKEDIPIFIDYYIDQFNKKYGRNVKGLSAGLKNLLLMYHWPGNVREIRHVLESMINVTYEEVLTAKNLPAYVKEVIDMNEEIPENITKSGSKINLKIPLKDAMEKVEKEYITRALMFTRGNITLAAEFLDLPRQTLKFKMDKLKIENHK